MAGQPVATESSARGADPFSVDIRRPPGEGRAGLRTFVEETGEGASPSPRSRDDAQAGERRRSRQRAHAHEQDACGGDDPQQDAGDPHRSAAAAIDRQPWPADLARVQQAGLPRPLRQRTIPGRRRAGERREDMVCRRATNLQGRSRVRPVAYRHARQRDGGQSLLGPRL